MSGRTYLSIGDVLSLLRQEFPDVTISKIRFLESQGLVNPERSPSGYRKFYERDVERLRWVLRQQREHFLPLKVIRDRLAGTDGVPSDDADAVEPTERDTISANGTRESDDADPPAEPAMVGAHRTPPPVAVSATDAPPLRPRVPTVSTPSAGAPTPVPAAPAPTGAPAAPAPAMAAPVAAAPPVAAPVAAAPPVAAPVAAAPPVAAPVAAAPPAAARTTTAPVIGRRAEPDPPAAVARADRPTPAAPAPDLQSVAARPEAEVRPAETPPSGSSLTIEELCHASGLSITEVAALEGFGLVEPVTVAGTLYYDEECLTVAKLVSDFARYGIEPRHLRLYRNAVDRELGLVEQIITPLLRQRNPEARKRAADTAADLNRLGQQLRGALLRKGIRNHFGR
ncbi:MAG TPA: MerR family transcriptional regulator [Acidimicrobiales bacterium]|nr:MerR family transcriptional regulator [Acidimicrobiales bacterium]